MRRTKNRPNYIDVASDYKEANGGDWDEFIEQAEISWIGRFGDQLNQEPDAPAAWARVKRNGYVMEVTDSLYLLNASDSPYHQPGSGVSWLERRQLYTELKRRFTTIERLLKKVEVLNNYKNPNVIDFGDSFVWPPARKKLAELAREGKELANSLQKHFKTMSHGRREERDEISFGLVVLDLRKCGCKLREIATIIRSGMKAEGRINDADKFDEWKLKDELKKLRRMNPEAYRRAEAALNTDANS